MFFITSVVIVLVEISECIVETKPKLTNHEKLIVVEKNNVEKIFNENGAMITGKCFRFLFIRSH